MKQLENKIALVTGGNSGIGFATAQRFIEEGATVIITGRRQDALDRAVEELGPQASGILADSSNIQDINRLGQQIESKFGRLDVAFLNAGIALMGPFDGLSEEGYDQMFDINVKGVFFTIQALKPVLSENSSVVLNASVVGNSGMTGGAAYAATKAAVRSLGRSFASELAPQGIRVNTVSPGPIETPIFSKVGLPQESLDEFGQNLATRMPLGRFGKPEEIADVVVFLASNRSSYITGAEIQADGGLTQVTL